MSVRKKLYIFLECMIVFAICFFSTKQEVKADSKLADFEKEIEEQGFRVSMDGMEEEDILEYFHAIVRASIKTDNPLAPIRDKLDQLYMGDKYLAHFEIVEKKGDVYIGIARSTFGGSHILPCTLDKLGETSFKFIIRDNWEIQILEDTITSSEPDYLLTIPTQMIYHQGEYIIWEHHSEWRDEAAGMVFEITFPFLMEQGDEEWNKWIKVNSVIRDAAAEWIAKLDRAGLDEVKMDYEIKTLDSDLYSILFTETDGGNTYQFGVTVSLKTGKIVPLSVLTEKGKEDDIYYISSNVIYTVGDNGRISYTGKLEYQPFHLEERIEEIYDDTGVLIGTVSFQYPLLDSKKDQAVEINKNIICDVETFYTEIMDVFEKEALSGAEQIRELYKQEGQEGYEHEMNMWEECGGYTFLSVDCSVVKNNYGEWKIMYELRDKDYFCTYNIRTAEETSGSNYLNRLVNDALKTCNKEME